MSWVGGELGRRGRAEGNIKSGYFNFNEIKETMMLLCSREAYNKEKRGLIQYI